MTLFMETTKKTPAQSIGEIQGLLMDLDFVTGIQVRKKNGELEGVAFSMDVEGNEVSFLLPAKPEPIFDIFQARRKRCDVKQRAADQAQAERVAWRQILRWIEAQVALIETGMVEPPEVFLPYAVIAPGKTLYQLFIQYQAQGLMLPAPKEVSP